MTTSSCPIYKNEIDLTTFVAPVKGSAPLKYCVKAIECPRMPFLPDELLQSIAGRTLGSAEKQAFKDLVAKNARKWLLGNGLDIEVNVDVKVSAGGIDKLAIKVEGDKYISLFVDLGSTNSKWIVSNVSPSGELFGFAEIVGASETENINNIFGLDYDKQRAYSLEEADFKEWLAYIVLGFIRQIQRKHCANIVDVVWSFPQVEKEQKSKRAINFAKVGEYITELLKGYGLMGKFTLLPEGDALKYMFINRLRELAIANETEISENEKREKEEKANKQHNYQEMLKVAANKHVREKEEREWRKEHWFKSKLGFSPAYKTDPYNASYKTESLGRLEVMKSFRKTGACADGQFNVLILDAGGSTLDYCFVPHSKAKKPISGSFLAGGNQLTELIKQDGAFDSLEDAENSKRERSKLQDDKVLAQFTKQIYEKAVANIVAKCKKIGAIDSIVITGLAMCNLQLRKLIYELIGKGRGLMLMYSPIISELFPREMMGEFPLFKDFILIVKRNSEKAEPWPANDVTGGLYFYKKEG